MPQPHRGDRKPISFRVPASLREEVDRRAGEAGLNRGEYLTKLLAIQHDLPVPAYIPDGNNPKQLRLLDGGARMSA